MSNISPLAHPSKWAQLALKSELEHLLHSPQWIPVRFSSPHPVQVNAIHTKTVATNSKMKANLLHKEEDLRSCITLITWTPDVLQADYIIYSLLTSINLI